MFITMFTLSRDFLIGDELVIMTFIGDALRNAKFQMRCYQVGGFNG